MAMGLAASRSLVACGLVVFVFTWSGDIRSLRGLVVVMYMWFLWIFMWF